MAAEVGATAMQMALAWLLTRGPNVLLISSTSSPDHLRENLATADLSLLKETLVRLWAIGGRQR